MIRLGSSSSRTLLSCLQGPYVHGFARQVVVFNSKQRPKRMTLLCDDLGEHDFVVKVGARGGAEADLT